MLDFTDPAVVAFSHCRAHEALFGLLNVLGVSLNAFMNIQVRVLAGQATAAMRAMQAGLAGMNAQMLVSDTRSRGASRSLTAWGNQVQWTGRQIQTNWTLPLLAAAGAATHWELQNQEAFTRISKVYGTAGMSAATIRNELEALDKAFEALSNRYGVQQKEVLEIAGDWAAAGASGIALARGVEATLQAMVLGELKSADATKALISIQAQYGTDTRGLIKIIGTLNSVENETGVSMGGLIQGFARSAGVARQAGVDYRHLAAMIAALSPAAGSATEAGNALKTIFSRLASPTRETTQVLGLMGISMDDMNWKSANAVEQLQILSKKFETLSDKQKEVVSTVVASRWQINKFSILMRELSTENGYYQKALDATKDSTKVYAQYQRELNAVLSSNPHKVQQIWVMLQNAATDIIQPMIPIILYLMNAVRLLVTAFSNLDPALQKLILFGALALAMVGPVVRYVGAILTLTGALGSIASAMLLPFTAAFAGMSAIVTKVGAGIRLAWLALMVNLRGITFIGMAWIQGAWAAGLGGLRAYMSTAWLVISTRWASLMAVLPRTMAAAGLLMRTVWTNALLALAAVQIAAGALLTRGWAAVLRAQAVVTAVGGRAIQAVYSGLMFSVAALSSVVYPLVMRAWTAMMTGVFIITNAWTRLTAGVYRAFAMGLSPITAAAGALIARTWAVVSTAFQYVMLAGTMAYTAIWRLFAFGLAPITAAAGRLITAAWVVTLRAQMIVMAAAQRAWAAAWAGMVAIASAGTRAVALVTAAGTRVITLLAMAPARVAGLFRGGWALLLGVGRAGLAGLTSLVTAAVGAISWPVVAIVAAVVILVAAFWDEIKQLWNNIVDYFSNSGNGLVSAMRNIFGSLGSMMRKVFNKLPESVKNAMVAVVKLVAAAAHKVYELFSYINPFAHHSPSLVENVTNGMAEVRKQFATLGDVEKYVMSAYNTLQKFGGVAASMGQKQQEAEWSDQRKDISKVQPSALPAFDALTNQIRVLTPILNQLKGAVDAQQRVVDVWQKKLDAANDALDRQEKKLRQLQDVANKLSDALNKAKQDLDNWVNTPIKGEQAMADAIFANEQAQKRLQLQMMKMEDVVGPLDEIKNKMSSINGEIDTLHGMRSSMQQAGAGSDILSVYDDQLKQLEGSKSGLTDQAKALQDMQKQLDELQRKGQELNLEQSLNFDGLHRQIEQASKDLKEMPFDVILAGTQASRAEVDRLAEAYNKANTEVARQQQVVDAATKARDAIQARYDTENKKLQQLKDAYDAVNQAIQNINDSLQKMSQYASDSIQRKEAKKKKKKKGESLSPGAQNFLDAAGGNFADVGSDLEIGREGGLGDQSKQIDDFTKQLAKETSGMFAGLNPLAPLKKWWDKAWNWLKTYIGPLFTGLGDFISKAFSGIPNPFSGAMGGWGDKIKGFVDGALTVFGMLADGASSVFGTIWGAIKAFWDFAQPIFEHLWDGIVDGLSGMWQQIWPEIQKFGDLIAPMGEAISNLWTLIKPIMLLIFADLAAGFMFLVDIVAHTIGPVLKTIGAIIGGVIRILRGIIEFIVGVFTLDFDMVWKGIVDIFGGVWDIIVGILKGAWNIVLGILMGAIDWVGHVFAFIWDKVKGPFQDAWKNITSQASAFKTNFLNIFYFIRDWIVGKGSALMKILGDAWDYTMQWIGKKALGFKDSLLLTFRLIKDWFTNKFNGIMDSVSDRWQSVWKNLTKWFNDAKDWVTKPLKDGINGAISAVNLLIQGLNKLADVLPGLDWHISLIPKLATGGNIPSRRVGAGFRTNGPRAIVGEGNQRYPEYVIPTDPMYRGRAFGLLGGLVKDLGVAQAFMGDVPAYKSGGILGTISDAIGDAGDFFKGLGSDIMSHIGDGVATYIVDPFFKLADPFVAKFNWKMLRGLWDTGKLKIKDWLKFTDDATKQKYEEGGAAAVPAGKIRDWITQALGIIKEPMTLAKGIYNIIMHESGGNPRAINLWDSNAKAGHPSKGLMQTIDGTFNAYSIKGHKDIWNPIDNIIAGTRYAIANYGRKWLESGGNRDKNGNYTGYASGGILNAISRTVPSLAEGAYIRRTVGGTLVRVGEGQTDEAVVPLPNGVGDLSGGGKTYNFYGDLSFPNITSADDAKRFIENLEDLAAG